MGVGFNAAKFNIRNAVQRGFNLIKNAVFLYAAPAIENHNLLVFCDFPADFCNFTPAKVNTDRVIIGKVIHGTLFLINVIDTQGTHRPHHNP